MRIWKYKIHLRNNSNVNKIEERSQTKTITIIIISIIFTISIINTFITIVTIIFIIFFIVTTIIKTNTINVFIPTISTFISTINKFIIITVNKSVFKSIPPLVSLSSFPQHHQKYHNHY